MTIDTLVDYLINAEGYEIPVARFEYQTVFNLLASDEDKPAGAYSLQLVLAAVTKAQEDPYIEMLAAKFN